MRKAYPIIISKVDDVMPYSVYIPDFDAYTQGEDVADAINMSRDLIGLTGLAMTEDFHQEIPLPGAVEFKLKENDTFTLVDIDFDQYKRENDRTPVKKTLTIPSYLNTLGVEKKVNFSALLTQALQETLKV
ncbi:MULTISPECIES: type II toxin-antitoxin system HicB family antitoxin [unclassified Lactococcus]|uniref:type II toxin-antitoxin system HicB family antitoxin n=1 Tax=unclassified Lactococcus TaxID=2643510 RepID=UPI001E4FA91F|nr:MULTISPECIES: type II toxin-antitoxin system HicB family antitoxin [unclassified Lactococcus]